MDGFLEETLEEGWNDHRRKEFTEQYGELIITSISYHVRNYYPPHQVNLLREHLVAILERRSVKAPGGIVGDLLKLGFNTYQDTFQQGFKNDLIGKYVNYVAEKKSQHAKFIDFEAFLEHNVRYQFLNNISKGPSQKELFDKILAAKNKDNRNYFIHEARSRYAGVVEGQFRSKFPQLGAVNVNNVIDYFFEQYVPREYQKLVCNLSTGQLRKKTLSLLINGFSKGDCQQGSTYRRQVYGLTEVPLPESHAQGSMSSPEEIPVSDEIHRYYAMMVRCKEPDPTEIEQQLIPIRQDPQTICCLAFASLKEEFGKKERKAARKARNKNATGKDRRQAELTKSKKENLRALIISFCTREEKKGNPPPQHFIDLNNLTYEDVTGWSWRWEEDICRGLFNRTIRKDRIENQLRQWLLKSKYV